MTARLSMGLPETRIRLLLAVLVAGVVAVASVGPIPQDIQYHVFADRRTLGGVGHFWNVVSNLPFLMVGIFGLLRLPRLSCPETRSGYGLMCMAVALVGLGSAYYHSAPANSTLLWDRLPMTVAFMAFLSLLLGERVIRTHQPYRLWLLVAIGMASALYWYWTESLGRGDLRPYVLVQFLPVGMIPLILALYPQRYLDNRLLLAAFGLYFAAKVLEYLDATVMDAIGFMSGHAIKHVVAAIAVLCIIQAVPVRHRAEDPAARS